MSAATREVQTKKGRAVLIREAVADDAAGLLEYVETISGQSDFLSFGPGEFDATEADERAFLTGCQSADNQLFLIALVDDAIVGTLHFLGGARPRTRHAGEIGMSVHADYWSEGIGSALLDVIIDWAGRNEVISKINLRVRTDNERAMALYRRKGFSHEGTISREVFLNGEFFAHHWMGLEV